MKIDRRQCSTPASQLAENVSFYELWLTEKLLNSVTTSDSSATARLFDL